MENTNRSISRKKKSMRCFFIFTVFSLACISLSAQKNKKEDEQDYVFTKVEIESGPEIKSWNAYLKKAATLSASESAGIPVGIYKVNVQFIIDKYGNITEATAKNNPGYGLAKKAEKIVLHFEGVCRPASQCGREVKSYKMQVIEFVVKK